MTTFAAMRRFGLIGDPVKGSLSPALFQAGYHGRYIYDLIEGADFETSYRTFLDRYDGINVTAPFKEQALRRADSADQTSRKTGAANLIVKTASGTRAFNTDYIGIQRSLLENFPGSPSGNPEEIRRSMENLYGRRVKALVIGCGGAGKAAAVAAADLGMETTLTNRTLPKAEKIAADLPEYSFRTRPLDELPDAFWQSDIIIYTLPGRTENLDELRNGLGSGRTSLPCSDLPKLILEANYKKPSFDSSLFSAIKASAPGAIYISGLRWLFHQAAGGYSLFTGEEPDSDAMEQALACHLK